MDHFWLFIFCIYIAALQSPAGMTGLLAGLLARLFEKFSCVFVSFLCGILGQVWYLIVLIPDLCILTYLVSYIMGVCVRTIFSL